MQNQHKHYKKKLKLNELSDLLKIKKSTIKSWEQTFQLPSLNNTLYTEKEIVLFQKIKHLLMIQTLSIQEVEKEIAHSLTNQNIYTPAQHSFAKESLDTQNAINTSYPMNTESKRALNTLIASEPVSPQRNQNRTSTEQEIIARIKKLVYELHDKLTY